MKIRSRRKSGSREDPYNVDLPCLGGVVVGVREWQTNSFMDVLRPLNGGKSWAADGVPTRAVCKFDKESHDAPDASCECGLYAHHPWSAYGRCEIESCYHRSGFVLGFVFAWGKIEVHREGFRAEYAKPAAFLLADISKLSGVSDPAGYERVMRQLATRCGADLIDLRIEGSVDAWLAENPGQLLPETVERLIPGVRLGPCRFESREQVSHWFRSGAGKLGRAIGYLLYGLLMTLSVGVQLLWWGFILYALVVALTGIDPLDIDGHLGPQRAESVHARPDDWHPPKSGR